MLRQWGLLYGCHKAASIDAGGPKDSSWDKCASARNWGEREGAGGASKGSACQILSLCLIHLIHQQHRFVPVIELAAGLFPVTVVIMLLNASFPEGKTPKRRSVALVNGIWANERY